MSALGATIRRSSPFCSVDECVHPRYTVRGMPSPKTAILTSVIVMVISSAVTTQEPTRVAPREATMRPEIVGQTGIVAGGRHYSVHAGTRILEQGGNAIDAGVATVFAASVVEISHFGF